MVDRAKRNLKSAQKKIATKKVSGETLLRDAAIRSAWTRLQFNNITVKQFMEEMAAYDDDVGFEALIKGIITRSRVKQLFMRQFLKK